jgi:putative Mg2+ transporter-C (MgtC) family protein
VNGAPTDIELVLRLVLAGLVGAGVGIEREIHGHPAGMRTHLLVALGSAVFTVLSFHSFAGFGGDVDPSRIASQVVSGIGFLGAGAILKEGFTIRGLTTAASLWSTAALGMAAGVGEYVITLAATAIVLISLWPLRPISSRLEGARASLVQVHLDVESLVAVNQALEAVQAAGLVIAHSHAHRQATGRYDLELEVRGQVGASLYASLSSLDRTAGVLVVGVDQLE